jgi:predicted phosphodiesterase
MIGIISDIHGNLHGLNLVLGELSKQNCTDIICLGDLVDGGEYNAEVIDRIISLKITCVRGNHDEINSAQLDEKRQSWLNSLPDEIINNDICYTHISPRLKRKRKINTGAEAWNVFDETNHRLVFVGHTHITAVFMDSQNAIGSSVELNIRYNTFFDLGPNNRYVISPGAVGYSRDNRNTIRYGLFDNKNNQLSLCELDGPTIQ